jgi:hypothetical protein
MVTYIFIGSKYIAVKNIHIVPSKPCFWYAIEPMDCITAARLQTTNTTSSNVAVGGEMLGKAKNSAKGKKKLIKYQSPSAISETTAHMSYTSSIYM